MNSNADALSRRPYEEFLVNALSMEPAFASVNTNIRELQEKENEFMYLISYLKGGVISESNPNPSYTQKLQRIIF